MAWRGCFLKWAKTDFIRYPKNISRSSRVNPYNQQRCSFRREAKRPDTKKENITQELNTSPSEAGTAGPPPPPYIRKPTLFRPLIFTVGFTGCSFGVSAILQYETIKSKVQTAKDGEELEKLALGSPDMAYWHDWWNQLSGFRRQLILLMSMVDDLWNSLTEGQRTATGIIAINAAVLCCWRIPSMQRTMIKYFTSNPASRVNSTMVSYLCKTATGRFYPSLGASGAVMAVLAAVCTKVPEAKLGIIFLPMVTFTAGNALKALVAIDTAGLMLGWRLFDHAAHLGGALFGVWYVAYGHKLLWRRREPLVKLWHNMRFSVSRGSRPGGRPGDKGGGGGPGHH
ncbi:presenilin-associated rhomboid-like protein A, mitochondrial isoform X2 [Nothobranchius furzeri]|uniref:presenilin-associated rhomboid-like protein A, mitochondrial isoform X2 n=1 Tax=Nothobranchius furzeri TaxID=105023 RepID=UPI002404118C|nr:presenilins-associated rhomboid-like protein, mitochondrial isoform X2 [Nothobranchius furzeri]